MSRSDKALGSGEVATVHCPCGWHGLRQRTSTQPCPSCDEPIDWTQVVRKRSGYQKKHTENVTAENRRIAKIQADANELERRRRAADDARISALLRADTEHLRPARKAEP